MSGSSTGPEASVAIDITYSDSETARFILEAISPDNLRAPPNMAVEAEARGSKLRVKISCRKGVGSLIATVDDLLSCVQAAEKAIIEVSN